MVNAIVLAGTDNKKGLINGQNKALLKIDNKPVINYIMDALKKSKYIEDIVLVGPKQDFSKEYDKIDFEDYKIFQEKGNLLENALLGYEMSSKEKSKNKDYTFFITCDIPMITSEAIDDFLQRCQRDNKSDLYFPIIKKESVGKYNELKRPYVELKQGNYRISNFILANVDKIKNLKQINNIANGRKLVTPSARLKLLYNFPDVFWKYFISKDLTPDYIKKRADKFLGTNISFIETTYPETTLDIDTRTDYEYLKAVMILKNQVTAERLKRKYDEVVLRQRPKEKTKPLHLELVCLGKEGEKENPEIKEIISSCKPVLLIKDDKIPENKLEIKALSVKKDVRYAKEEITRASNLKYRPFEGLVERLNGKKTGTSLN